jgi:hypothetical protein
MRFFVDNLPVAIIREEGIGLSGDVVNLRETEAVGLTDGLLIDTCSTYYIYVLIGLATLQGCVEGGEDLTARQLLDSS